jgi:hypothetical protein
MMMAGMTYEQADEILLLLKAAIGALGGIRDTLEKGFDKLAAAAAKAPPSSKRGGKS